MSPTGPLETLEWDLFVRMVQDSGNLKWLFGLSEQGVRDECQYRLLPLVDILAATFKEWYGSGKRQRERQMTELRRVGRG